MPYLINNFKNQQEYFQRPNRSAYKVIQRFKISNISLDNFGLKIMNDPKNATNIQGVGNYDSMSTTAPEPTIENIGNKDYDVVECAYCGSFAIIKIGKRKTKCGLRQRYQCKECNRKFVNDPIKGHKATAKLITLCMDLYFKGLSYRKIADTLFQFYDLKVHHETVRRWINKFMKAINKYVKTLEPKLSMIWCIDEQQVKTKEGWLWCWNAMDHDTRFLIANILTKKKDLANTHKIFQETKSNTKHNPALICTDGWTSYAPVIRNEYVVSAHKKNIALRDGGNNRVERYHGNWKERYKVMRGLENENTSKEMLENYRTYYNFIRPHQAIRGLTPAEMTGLNIGNHKWMELLEKSVK